MVPRVSNFRLVGVGQFDDVVAWRDRPLRCGVAVGGHGFDDVEAVDERGAAPDDDHVASAVGCGEVAKAPLLGLGQRRPVCGGYVDVGVQAVEFAGGASAGECLAFIFGGPPQCFHAPLDAPGSRSVPSFSAVASVRGWGAAGLAFEGSGAAGVRARLLRALRRPVTRLMPPPNSCFTTTHRPKRLTRPVRDLRVCGGVVSRFGRSVRG